MVDKYGIWKARHQLAVYQAEYHACRLRGEGKAANVQLRLSKIWIAPRLLIKAERSLEPTR